MSKIFLTVTTVIVSGLFLVSAIFTNVWVTDTPLTLLERLIDLVFFPHTILCLSILDWIDTQNWVSFQFDSDILSWLLLFLLSTPVSFVYALVAQWAYVVIKKSRANAS